MELAHGTIISAVAVDTGEEELTAVRAGAGADADTVGLGVLADEAPGQVFSLGMVSHAQSEELKPGIIVVVRSVATVPLLQLQ